METRRMTRLAGLLVAGGIAAGLVAGCSSSDSGGLQSASAPAMDSSGGGGSGTFGGAEKPAAAPPQQGPADQQGNQQGQVEQPGVDRKLVRTATLELAAANVVEVSGRAREVAVNLDGFAGQEEVRGDSASITLHIPSNQFDKALGQLSGLVGPEGVVSRSQTAEDVTEQLIDLESRIVTQRLSVARINALLARAQTVSEIVQIESEVTRRQADLESLEKRRERLSGQVALSKVTVRVTKAGAAPRGDDDDGFLGALAGGWNAFLTAGGVLLEVLGAMLPFLIVLGVPGWFALRWWLRRRKPAIAPPVPQNP